ncbi:MAG: hypothetical protein HN505_01950 [Verrucomicrobia bacterium]|nr:hypothetical protein [Verrucomicrobiota bacterium]MBT6239549.1 hypothetical protein [Verrucomicrobiota bacterium]
MSETPYRKLPLKDALKRLTLNGYAIMTSRMTIGWILSYGVFPLYIWCLPKAYSFLSDERMTLTTAIICFLAHNFIMFCMTALFLHKIKPTWYLIIAYVVSVLCTVLIGLVSIGPTLITIASASFGNLLGYINAIGVLIDREEAQSAPD